MLKIVSANWYVGNPTPEKDAHFLASLNPDAAGVQEGHSSNAQAIRRAIGGRRFLVWWGTSKNKEKAFGELDVPVVIDRQKVNVLKKWTRLISHRAQKENIGMPRAATAVRFEKGGKTYTFINTHCNAGVQSRYTKKHLPRKIRRVAEFIAGMIVLEAMIVNAKRRGDIVILVGDLNYSTEGPVWKFSPEEMFKRQKMNFKVHRIDYIAYTRDLVAEDFRVIDTRHTGSDHSWITAKLVPNPKKR